MRRSLLNKRILPKPLRQALVLITLLLLPSAAWGQWDTKTFIFNGCSENTNLNAIDSEDNTMNYLWYYQGASGIGLNEGKVKISVGEGSFDAKNTLKLANEHDYTIKQVTFSCSDLAITGASESSKIYVRAVNANPADSATIHYSDPYSISNGTLSINLDTEAGIPSKDLVFLIFSNDNKAFSFILNSITITKIADYNISIGGVPLTGSNVNPETGAVTGMTGISFSPADAENSKPATLTLNNANFGPSLTGIVWSGNGTLKIQYSGNNIINTRNGSELNAGSDDGYCILGKSSSDLILSASNAASTLTLTPSNGESGNSRAAISGFSSVSLDDSWGMYYTKNCAPASASSLTAGEEVIIIKGTPLGISVAGVVVTDKNQGDILGDGKVSFTSATTVVDNPEASKPAKLTLLNGAKISGNIQSSISPLTVYLKGSSEITPSNTSDAPFQYAGTAANGSLTFESSEADDGELTLGGTFSKEETGESEEKYFQFSSGNYTYTNSICPWYVRTDFQYNRNTYTYWGVKGENENIIFYNAHYGITIGDYEVTKFNKDMVTGSSGDFAYYPDGNYLFVPDNNSLSSYEIKSHKSELNIRISGDCAVKAIKFVKKAEEFGTPDPMVLNIDRYSESTPGKNTLTIDTESSEPAISGFTAVNISENLHFVTTAPAEGESYPSKVVLSDEVVYDLWVEGQQVSSRNKDNVKGETINPDNPTTPSVVFDSETSTLNLTNAHIIVTTSNENLSGVVSGLENLTVKFVGSNSIEGSGVTTFYGFKAWGDKTCNITFTATAGESFSFMAQAEPEYAVSGFSKVTYKDDLGAFTDNGNFYICEELSLGFDTAWDDNSNPIGVKITSSGKIVSHKIVYAIDYAKDDLEDIPETEYTDVIPLATITAGPCIFTAYTLSLDGENTKSNNIKYYYFQYSDSEVIIGNGTTIDLKDYLLPTLTGEDEVDLYNSSEQSGSIISINSENNTLTGIAYGTAIVSSITEGVSTFTFYDSGYELSIKVTVQDIIDESTFASGQSYGTFFNTTEAYNVPEGLKAYIITDVNEEKGTIEMTETSVLPPNTPVLMYRTSTTVSPNYVFTKASNVEPVTTKLKYTTTDKPAEESSKLYVLYNGQFVKVTSGTKILANHCYLDLANTSSGTRSYYDIDGSDGTTSIREVRSEGVKGEKLADGEWYTLQGQRVTKPTKPGLYILNGKKVVIK